MRRDAESKWLKEERKRKEEKRRKDLDFYTANLMHILQIGHFFSKCVNRSGNHLNYSLSLSDSID